MLTYFKEWYRINIVGVDDAEGTPVPISNTVVKLGSAENTWLATAREDRKTPTFFIFIFFNFSIDFLFLMFYNIFRWC